MRFRAEGDLDLVFVGVLWLPYTRSRAALSALKAFLASCCNNKASKFSSAVLSWSRTRKSPSTPGLAAVPDDVGCGDVGTGASRGDGPGGRLGVVPSPRCENVGDVLRSFCLCALLDDEFCVAIFAAIYG